MCTDDAGPEQSLVLFSVFVLLFFVLHHYQKNVGPQLDLKERQQNNSRKYPTIIKLNHGMFYSQNSYYRL